MNKTKLDKIRVKLKTGFNRTKFIFEQIIFLILIVMVSEIFYIIYIREYKYIEKSNKFEIF